MRKSFLAWQVALPIFLALLFVAAFSIPAFAATGPDLGITASNPTIYQSSDYTLNNFNTISALSVGDVVYFSFPSGFDLSSVSAGADVTVAGYTYNNASVNVNGSVLYVTIPAAGSTFDITVHNVKNPSSSGGEYIIISTNKGDNTGATVQIFGPGGTQLSFDNLPGSFVAGQAAPVTITLRDQDGHPAAATSDLTVGLSRTAYVNSEQDASNTSGAFYASLDGSGNPSGSPIPAATIPAGSVSVTVYYRDTQATNFGGHGLALGVWSQDVTGTSQNVSVHPAAPTGIALQITDWDSDNGLQVSVPGQGQTTLSFPMDGSKVQTKLLANESYPLRVSVVDQYGNPGAQRDSSITVYLSASPANVHGKFYQFTEQGPGNQITYMNIGPNEPFATVDFNPNGDAVSGTIKVDTTVAGLQAGQFAFQAIRPTRLRVTFVQNMYNNQWVPTYFSQIAPGQRYPVIIGLFDEAGRPAYNYGNDDVALILSADQGAFYTDYQSAQPVTTAEIPAGCHGVLLYYQAPDAEGSYNLTVTGIVNELPEFNTPTTVTVADQTNISTTLLRGWNTLSTPFVLDKPQLDQIVQDPDYIGTAYAYDSANKRWQLIYKAESGKWLIGTGNQATDTAFNGLQPLDAIYVKMLGVTGALFYPSNANTVPSTKALNPGWNLIGASFDVNSQQNGWWMKVGSALNSIAGKYSQVVSPALGFQYPWAYVPGGEYDYAMNNLNGYWVYMTANGTLAGFGYTPLDRYHYAGCPVNAS